MSVRKTVGTVGTLAQEAVSTAVSVVKHPIGSTAVAAGLVKGAAGAGIGLVRSTITGTSPTPHSDTPPAEVPAEPLAREAEVPETEAPETEAPETEAPETEAPETEAPETTETIADPRDNLPGPDLAHFEPPSPDELPEPIVIEADDAPINGESGEPFHNEPKATSRDSEHGAGPIDPEELDEYVEDITTPVEGGPQQ
jgi:hypothetical protein